jgi:hypothetical protein
LIIVLTNKISKIIYVTPNDQLNLAAWQIKKDRAKVYFFVLALGQVGLIHAVIIINIALFLEVQNFELLRHLWVNRLCFDLDWKKSDKYFQLQVSLICMARQHPPAAKIDVSYH